MVTVDLNSDVGESFGAWSMGDDAAMLGVVQELLPRLAAEIIAQMTKDGAAP